jgi:hypothetical protein
MIRKAARRSPWRRALVAAVCLCLALPLWPADAAARSFSSGGYSRPSVGSFRTPSIRPPSGGSFFGGARTPSTSGGYTRPSLPSFGTRPRSAPTSPGDLGVSRRGAAEALQQYRAQQQERRTPSIAPAPSPGGYARIPRRGGVPDWYAGRGWTPPPWTYGTPRRFGVWDGLFLWFLLDTLSRPGHAQWFHDHQNDPGVQQWRENAQREAQDNPQLRGKLGNLDQALAQRQGEPRDPNYLPPDTPAAVARAAPAPRPFAPGLVTSAVVLLVGIGFLFFLWRQRRAARGAGGSTGGGKPMKPLRTAGEMLRHKLSGEPYTPSRFRLGMTLTLDPTPFVLAAGSTKVPRPAAAGETVSVQAVGTLGDGGLLHRLYLDEASFFQLHLGEGGIPDECRYFARIDQVTPADANEWGFWLDQSEGVIGWPQFQTKDGKLYDRAWSPGGARVPPRRFEEKVETAQGTETRRLQAMLYAAPTGAAPPAPATEYVLVAAAEAGAQAWVDISAGIDVNPAALSLT